MKFKDWSHYESVLNAIGQMQEDHLTNFEEEYPNLTNEELDTKEEEIGFRYYKPFIEFENSLQFSSLRAKIEAEIVAWLDNEPFDITQNPNRKHRHSVDVRTLLNEDYIVKIGEEIINLSVNDEFGNSQSSSRSMMNCWSFGKAFDDDEYNDGYKYEAFLEYDSYPFVMKAHAEITHFKRKSNGKWKRSRADLSINVAGKTYDEECRPQAPLSYFEKDKKSRKSLDVRVHIYSGRQLRAMDNEVTSNFTVGNEVSDFITIN